jgi:hypothetical protein
MMKAKFFHAGPRALRFGSKIERREYYFVLTTSSLSWYKTAKEDDLKGAFNITPDVMCKSSSDTGGLTQFSFRKSAGG